MKLNYRKADAISPVERIFMWLMRIGAGLLAIGALAYFFARTDLLEAANLQLWFYRSVFALSFLCTLLSMSIRRNSTLVELVCLAEAVFFTSWQTSTFLQ